MNKKSTKNFILKRTHADKTAFSMLFDTKVVLMLEHLLKHFTYNNYFTSNAYTKKKICEELEMNGDVYYRNLKRFVDSKILIEQAKGYYMLNHNLLEPILE